MSLAEFTDRNKICYRKILVLKSRPKGRNVLCLIRGNRRGNKKNKFDILLCNF